MQFTNNEIVFLTSVSKGRVPLGTSYRMPQMVKGIGIKYCYI